MAETNWRHHLPSIKGGGDFCMVFVYLSPDLGNEEIFLQC